MHTKLYYVDFSLVSIFRISISISMKHIIEDHFLTASMANTQVPEK